jgi:hypothetical protein
MPAIYIPITDHGFGHAARTAAIAAQIQKLLPELELILVTTAPDWLLSGYLDREFSHRRRSFDVGVIQSDSLKMDLGATYDRWQDILSRQEEIIREEVAFIQARDVRLIFGDIPPLATLIAERAGIPCWLSSNFGWDLIYREWGEDFAEITNWISDCYQQCDRLFRVPLHESMDRFPHIEDVGLTGGTPKFTPDRVRAELNFNPDRQRTILLTFGGFGVDGIPYQNISQFPDYQFITFDRQAPDLPNLMTIHNRQFRPVDLMPLCDLVVSKPGYTTYAEALKLDIPIATITRSGFAESQIIMDGMQDYGYHQVITPDRFFGNNWDFLNQEPLPPRRSTPVEKNGDVTIARSIQDYFMNSVADRI